MYLQSLVTVHVRWPGETGGAFGFALIFLVLFVPIHREQKEHKGYSNRFYVLSFACAKERTKEKHTGNDLQPWPSR